MQTISKPATLVQVGDIIRAHGARFEVVETVRSVMDGQDVQANVSRWLEGATIRCYFGPGKDFNFQGNEGRTYAVEVQG